ncbi:type VII secretion protein EccE [Mycobacterium sp. M1]|uniref:Type VII secretion protein EccE n=1 Tax=Mycolicibacter acidiphilus TaxID=2835306 RepID=A0ABS5REE9_9MYCO|nr:type VII secretion protein EccE [Mycolicibacter acidiphilus]MBS9532660.1 type VII secretion protein EccE [Mycolicibacter acidiphilus]
MKAQHALGLSLSWTRITVVFLIDIAILVLAGRWPGDAPAAQYAWWSGVGVAALITIIALVTYRRVPLSTMCAAWVADQFADPETALDQGRTLALDHHRRYGHEPVGIREYRGRLVTMIAVGGRQLAGGGRHSRGSVEPVTFPVELVAAGLRQFDVRLESIDIVTVGTRENPVEDEVVPDSDDEMSFPDHRTTWLILRMNPLDNVNAVATRDSLAATLVAATERLAEELDGRTVSARVVGADHFADVDEAVLAGLEPGQLRHRLFQRRLRYVSSFWVTPRDINEENLEHLWYPQTDATVVTVRLTPKGGRTTEVAVVVRYHSAARLSKNVRSALNRFVGRRQLDAVCASLPAPSVRPGLTTLPGRELRGDEHLPVSLDPVDEYAAARTGTRS